MGSYQVRLLAGRGGQSVPIHWAGNYTGHTTNAQPFVCVSVCVCMHVCFHCISPTSFLTHQECSQ